MQFLASEQNISFIFCIQKKIHVICVGFSSLDDQARQIYKGLKKYFHQKDYKKISKYAIDDNNQNKTNEFVEFAVNELYDIAQIIYKPQQSTIYQPNFNNKVQKFSFQVFTCELKKENLIQYLDIEKDDCCQFYLLGSNESHYKFQQKVEFQNCLKWSQPFYQDYTKNIFLMEQKKNDNSIDLYALTTSFDGPFKSILAAAQFIKSHYKMVINTSIFALAISFYLRKKIQIIIHNKKGIGQLRDIIKRNYYINLMIQREVQYHRKIAIIMISFNHFLFLHIIQAIVSYQFVIQKYIKTFYYIRKLLHILENVDKKIMGKMQYIISFINSTILKKYTNIQIVQIFNIV